MDFVTLKELAQEFGLDRSNVRKYVLSAGFEPVRVRTPESRGQLTLALTVEDAETVRDLRDKEGFIKSQVVDENGDGYIYVIQLVPELKPERIKLGYTKNIQSRLKAHKTTAPTAKILKEYPCKRTWEPAAISVVTKDGCILIGGEVYDCTSLDTIMNRCDAFFMLMPQVDKKGDEK